MIDHAALLARLDELEAQAKAATPGPWVPFPVGADIRPTVSQARTARFGSRADATFACTWNPRTALAVIRMTRWILRDHSPSRVPGYPWCTGAHQGLAAWPCDDVYQAAAWLLPDEEVEPDAAHVPGSD